MRGLHVVGVLGLVGCNSLVGTDPFQLANCFGSLVEVCLPSPPTGDVEIVDTTGNVDTETDPRCVAVGQTDGPKLCVIAGSTITMTGDVYTYGQNPLVLIGADVVAIGGQLWVSPGSIADCAPPGDGQSGTDGAGGAGGSFGSPGEAGGDSHTGIAGGVASASVVPMAIRGGCPGGAGANPLGSTMGLGGFGGGAVYLIAGHTITVDGAIYAPGSGGGGGAGEGGGGGGGGGGTGGLIALDARTIAVSGLVVANGGGGGGGGTDVVPGFFGAAGNTTMYMTPASGGNNPSGSGGGAGGSGAAVFTPPTPGEMPSTTGGGGGGGGGAGMIWVHGDLVGTRISPEPTHD